MVRLAWVAAALAVSALALPSALASHGPATVTAAQLCGAEQMAGVGLACERANGLLQMFAPTGEALGYTHGMDAVPPRSVQWPGGVVEPRLPACIETPGPGDHYNMLLYVRAVDDTDRYATMAPQVAQAAMMANAILHDEGLPFGRSYDYIFDCQAGAVQVHKVVLPTPRALDSASSIFADLRDLGYDDPRVKYWAWYDDTAACTCGGIGHIFADDRAIEGNWNNGNSAQGMIGITFGYTGLQGARIMMHENGHNMGAVQDSAPNADGGFHCHDGLDVMCYFDPWAPDTCSIFDGSYCENTCFGVMHFDCGHDDYFHPSPPDGSYLATHWNVASPLNRFLAQSALDNDLDGTIDEVDPDDDNDAVADQADNCPLAANADQRDFNGDGLGDACQPELKVRGDRDGDGVPDKARRANPILGITALAADNCRSLFNPGQDNFDADGSGDACDTDDDGDGKAELDRSGNPLDNCGVGEARPYNPAQLDLDGDGRGDACDEDDDGDGVADGLDTCRVHANEDQANVTACAPPLAPSRADRDGDGVPDKRLGPTGRMVAFDNCSRNANPDQADYDGDGKGDVCDTDDDNDGQKDTREPLTALDHARWAYL